MKADPEWLRLHHMAMGQSNWIVRCGQGRNPTTAIASCRGIAITMTTVFTDAGKVAGFIIQRGRTGFEAFDASALRGKQPNACRTAIRELGAPTRLLRYGGSGTRHNARLGMARHA
jgi:hypothetical protein